jgi:hypothetical protein
MSYEELFVRLLLENLRGKPRQVSAIAFQISSAYMIAYAFRKIPCMGMFILPLMIVLWIIALVSNWWLINKVSIDEVTKDVVGMLPEVIKELKEDISIEAFINKAIEKLTSSNKISNGKVPKKVFKVFAVITIPYILALVFTFLFIERVLGLPIMNLQGMYLAMAVACIAFIYEFLSAPREAEVHGDIMGIVEHELIRNVFDITMLRFTTLASIVKEAFRRKIPMRAATMLNDLCTPSPIMSLLTHENEKDNESPMATVLIPCNELVIEENRMDPLVNELMTQCIENLRIAFSSLGAQSLCVDKAAIDSIVNNLRIILRNCSRKSPDSGVSVHEETCDVSDVAGVPQLLSARLLQCITKALIEFPGCIENEGSLTVFMLSIKNFEIKYQVNALKSLDFTSTYDGKGKNVRGWGRFKIKEYTCKPRNTDAALKIPIITATGIHKANLNLILTKQLASGYTNNPNPNAPERRGTP